MTVRLGGAEAVTAPPLPFPGGSGIPALSLLAIPFPKTPVLEPLPSDGRTPFGQNTQAKNQFIRLPF